MSDQVLDIESSEQDNAACEIIEIVHGATAYRLTTGTRDISYGGNLYVSTPASRGEIGVVSVGHLEKEVVVTLPLDHAFVRRYLKQGLPPTKITATISRFYSESLVERIWEGEITSMSVDDANTEASFRVISRLGEALIRRLPTVTAGRSCPHQLYDATCAISRTGTNPDGKAYKCSTTVMYVNGRDVRLDLSTIAADYTFRSDWLVNGELVVTSGDASGERRTIREQNDLSPGFSTVTQVSLHHQIPGLKIGDAIDVFAGCKWDTNTCDLKFGNLQANGAYPYMPTSNPYVPGTRLGTKLEGA